MITLFLALLQVPALPVDSLVAAAVQRNAEIRTAHLNYEAAAALQKGAGALPEPMVMFRAFLEPGGEKTWRGFEAGIQQQIPWPGLRAAGREAGDISTRRAFSTLRDRVFFVSYEVRRMAYSWMMEARMLELENRQIGILERARAIADARVSSGRASTADVLMLDIRIDDMRTRRDARRRTLSAMEAELTAMTGMAAVPDTALPALPAALLAADTTGLGERAISLEPVRYMELMARNEARMAELDRNPMITGSFGMMKAAPLGVPESMDNRPMYMPQVNISLPLFSRKFASAAEAARIRSRAAAIERTQMKRMFYKDLAAAWADLENSRATRDLAAVQAGRAERVLTLRMQEYAAGAASFEMLSEALMMPLDFHAAELNALFSWHIARAWFTYLTATAS